MRLSVGRKKIRIGDVLVAAGAITEEQLQEGLAKQKETGRKLGNALVDLGFISNDMLITVLTTQLGIDYIELKGAKIEEKVTIETKHFKAEFLEKLQAAPNVDKAEYAGHQLVITYKSGKNNVAKLIEELSAAGITCNKIFSERPTLNDVFLELTGKELRD